MDTLGQVSYFPLTLLQFIFLKQVLLSVICHQPTSGKSRSPLAGWAGFIRRSPCCPSGQLAGAPPCVLTPRGAPFWGWCDLVWWAGNCFFSLGLEMKWAVNGYKSEPHEFIEHLAEIKYSFFYSTMNGTNVIFKKSPTKQENKIANPKPPCISLKPNLFVFNLLH